MFIRASIAEVIEQTGSISLLTDGERREHPETQPQVADSEIHANPVEAFNASLRWRNAAFRRKTNNLCEVSARLATNARYLLACPQFRTRSFHDQSCPGCEVRHPRSWAFLVSTINHALCHLAQL